ncbi:DUF551 domain-containing protein [Kluyvera cryocrescens]|uniref:DUF551 domain-containing protein n=1 Tax=Kluyvera cryocrescens TaxID=580 RepID=UPI0039F4EA16
MAKFTKELAKLFRKITNSEIDAEGNAHVVLFPADSLLINNARIALASLEAEAVAYMHHSGQVVTREECCDDKIFAICCKVETPLYAAPQLPQPAVPDDVLKRIEYEANHVTAFHHIDEHSCKVNRRDLLTMVNACRAAMLQGNHRDLSYPVDPQVAEYEKIMQQAMPDGWVAVPVEMTPSQMRAIQLRSEVGGYITSNLTGAYSLLSELWEVALAAAPKRMG